MRELVRLHEKRYSTRAGALEYEKLAQEAPARLLGPGPLQGRPPTCVVCGHRMADHDAVINCPVFWTDFHPDFAQLEMSRFPAELDMWQRVYMCLACLETSFEDPMRVRLFR